MSRLPDSFLQQTRALLGEEACAALCRALDDAAPVSIRLNPKKPCRLPAEADGRVAWCGDGVYLAERPAFTFDPHLHAGGYYVQEAASMFVEQAFRRMDTAPGRVLDLCAAPGGKSTLWRTLLPDGALLVANEPVRQRAQVLAENLAKWGHPDVVVTNAWPADFAALPGFFDVVAADVPCSGEGMFRKDAGAVEEWSPAAVSLCAERQMDIVRAVWPALRTGGYLVYSTCTFNRYEDEDNVRRICDELGAEPVGIDTPADWNIAPDATGGHLPVARFLPHRTRGEGFFLALLRKTAETPAGTRERRRRKAAKERSVAGAATLAGWLRDGGRFRLVRTGETQISALRETLADDMLRVRDTVHTLQAGVPLAEEKGRKLVPCHELALSTERAETAFPRARLDREQAIAYLRREALTLAPDVPRGYVTATYEGHALGFLNNLGARANNLYPQEWRIRSRHAAATDNETNTTI